MDFLNYLVIVVGTCTLISQGSSAILYNQGDHVSIICQVNETTSDVLYWMKSQHNGDTTQLGTNRYIKPRFSETNRYSISGNEEGTKVEFNLTIKNLQPEDSGTYQCYLASDSQNIQSLEIIVKVSITQLKLYTSNSNYTESDIQELENGGTLKLSEGQFHQFLCMSSGSFPEAHVSMWLGNKNITGMFEKNVKKITQGDPVKDKGLLKATYQTNLSNINHPLNLKYEQNGSFLRCEARLPGENVTKTHIKIVIKYKPRVTCNDSQMARQNQKSVQISCLLKAFPVLEDVTWYWIDKDSNNRSLSAGQEWSLYKAELKNGGLPGVSIAILHITEATAVTFREYKIIGFNSEGESKKIIRLVKDNSTSGFSSGSMTAPIMLMTVLITVATWRS